MNDHRLREQRLSTLQRWAETIPATLATLHERHGHHVHLRPTTSGLTLVGLTPERPQRGKGGFHDVRLLVDQFEELFDEHCVSSGHGRATPEKVVQSALLRDAYEHGRSMRLLNVATATTNDPVDVVFLTDELSLPDRGSEICCDILALRPLSADLYRPVVLELKSARDMRRLVEQVTRYAELVVGHREAFSRLAETLLERPVRLADECERWILWPRLERRREGSEHEPREAELGAASIRVFTYGWDSGELRLRGGATPKSHRQ